MEGFGGIFKTQKDSSGSEEASGGRDVYIIGAVFFPDNKSFNLNQLLSWENLLYGIGCVHVYIYKGFPHPTTVCWTNTCLCWCEYMSIWVVVKFLTVCGSKFTSRVAEMATLNYWRVCGSAVSVTISVQMRRGNSRCTNKEKLKCKLGFFRESRQRDIYIFLVLPLSLPTTNLILRNRFTQLWWWQVKTNRVNQVYRISIHFATCSFSKPHSEGFLLSEVHTQQRVICLLLTWDVFRSTNTSQKCLDQCLSKHQNTIGWAGRLPRRYTHGHGHCSLPINRS